MTDLRIVLEETPQKTFASALDWPGWSRSGKTADAAIDTLLAYADRYRAIADRAGIAFSPGEAVEIVDRLPGGGSTAFGVPSLTHEVDRLPIAGEELDCHVALLGASWDEFLAVAARVSSELKKGPRGGGRDRDAIVDHVVRADSESYARQLGVYSQKIATDPLDFDALRAHREAVLAAFPEYADGHTRTEKGWPLRYTIRRMAWHILDHAWEMEDKDLGTAAGQAG